MFAQLAQLIALARGWAGAPLICCAVAASAARLMGERLIRARHDLDPERIGEGQRHLVQARVALDLERESVDAEAAARNTQHHPQSAASGHLTLRRDDVDRERRREYRAQTHEASRARVAIAHFRFDLQQLAAAGARAARLAAPKHFETRI